jgi:aminoglycoside 3-N-acetyltransferase
MDLLSRLLYRFIRTYTGPVVRKRIKNFLMKTRVQLRPLIHLRYGTYTSETLICHLNERIKSDFDILMIHSSFDELSKTYKGSVLELLKELIGFCGNTRTLCMPAFSFQLPKKPDEKYGTDINEFDVLRTPSQMGLITEVFRRFNNVCRSMHPTASICALGPRAQELTADHNLFDTPYGKGTPFEKMTAFKTVILGLGVKYYRSLTQVHTAESLLKENFPLKLNKKTKTIRMVDTKRNLTYYNHTFYEDERAFNRGHDVIKPYLKPGELIEWRFHGAPLYLADAGAITRAVLAAAKDGKTIYDHR